VVAVGPELSRHYASAARLLPLDICLVPSADVGSAVPQRSYDGELRLLSVGRLEQEKNPLLLAEVLALLRADDPRWRLVVCGEGSLEGELRTRLAALGVEEHAEMLGYVPVDQGLLELYRTSHVFLHVSWTEGLPQVLFEAWAAGLPVVATAVGGVPEAVGDAALLVPPGEAGGAASAVRSLVADKPLRSRLVGAGADRLVGGGMEEGVGRLAGFLREVAATGRR
jgi:glycosyltransferase involved in cell wall biosynthesis